MTLITALSKTKLDADCRIYYCYAEYFLVSVDMLIVIIHKTLS